MAAQIEARALSHMDPETKYVHLLLQTWGRWAKDSGISGYPRCSPMEKAALYGKLGIPQESNYKGEPEIPDEVAQIDGAIARLCEIDKRAIVTYYTRWEAIETIAARCGMRVRQFQNVLRRARWRLMLDLTQTLNVTQ